MNIGLIDIDGTKTPNLVLMKLSAWHKANGDTVSVASVNDVFESNMFDRYDKFYAACVFSWNRPIAEHLAQYPNVEVGGIGVDKDKVLPYEIEHIYPDYSLYGIKDTAYGFMSRGCPRQCPFCVVAGKEGTKSIKVADLSEWWRGEKYIVLNDPNILACDDRFDLLQQLADSRAYVDVNQGLDIRLLDEPSMELLNNIKMKMMHFAWDNPKLDLRKQFLWFQEHTKVKNFRIKRVYVLVNYWSTFYEDMMRVLWLRDNGFDPYVMVYDKQNAPKKIKHLARWVNNKFVFRACDRFEDYDPKKG